MEPEKITGRGEREREEEGAEEGEWVGEEGVEEREDERGEAETAAAFCSAVLRLASEAAGMWVVLPSTEVAQDSELSAAARARFSFFFNRFFWLFERGAGSVEGGAEEEPKAEEGRETGESEVDGEMEEGAEGAEAVEGVREEGEEDWMTGEMGGCCCACEPSLETEAAGEGVVLPSTEGGRVRLLRLRERLRRSRSGACLAATSA